MTAVTTLSPASKLGFLMRMGCSTVCRFVRQDSIGWSVIDFNLDLFTCDKLFQSNVDTRTLLCFVTVAEELHFRRAADRLHLTQSALSQRICGLEREVGARLLERDRRHVALSEAGRVFLDHARSVLSQTAQAKAEVLRAARGEAGRLRLGFTVIAFYGVLPRAVRLLRERCPEVAVELREMPSPQQEVAVATGEVDLGILHPPLHTRAITVQALPAEELLLALPSSHRLARRGAVSVGDLDGEPFLIAPRAWGPHLYDGIIALFRGAGFSPRIVQEAAPMPTLVGLVAAGVGTGFVSASVARVARSGVVYRRVRPAPPSFPVAAAWRGPRPAPVARRFLDIVAELTDRSL